jgi:ribonuclease HI
MGPARDRDAIRRIHAAVDRALGDPDGAGREAVLRHAAAQGVARAAERLRRRATLLVKRNPQAAHGILAARDALMLAIYRQAAPGGWFVAWCDGSVKPGTDRSRAGIGGIVMDREGKVVTTLSGPVAADTAFDTEIAALAAVLHAAIDHGAERLCVYTDCAALVRHSDRHRRDRRLADVRKSMGELPDVELRLIPRKHNQPAHALALARAVSPTRETGGDDAFAKG